MSRLLCSYFSETAALSTSGGSHGRHFECPDELNSSIFDSPDDPFESDEACVTDENGDFGEQPLEGGGEGDDNSVSNVQIVSYQYQVQTTLDMTAIELNRSALQELEKALANFLVADLFGGEFCEVALQFIHQNRGGSSSQGDSDGQQQQGEDDDDFREEGVEEAEGEEGDLTGLSSAPADKLAPGFEGGALMWARADI